jgi:hypothetical protein
MGKQIIYLIDRQRKHYAKTCIDLAADDNVCIIQKKTRSLEQNSKLWAMLNDVSQQVEWYGRKLSTEDWKNVFSASLSQTDTVPGIDGGIVVLGQSTSKMTVSQMNDLIEIINAFGADKGVKFND